MSPELLCFNGIDADTGRYLLQLPPADLARIASGEPLDPTSLAELKQRLAQEREAHFEVIAGVDPNDISKAGWGVIFAARRPDSPEAKAQEAIAEALRPLLELRRAQAGGELYREYRGPLGYRAGESKLQFLQRHGVGPGPVDPHKVPYYLLLVGDPEEIPFRVQSQLGVQYAVGRLHFDRVEDYAHYAASVVAAETGGVKAPRRAVMFGPANDDDVATQSSSTRLLRPVAAALRSAPGLAGWTIDELVGPPATRQALADLLRDPPALWLSASHGMGLRMDDPRQLRHQGALLCQDWPGPLAWGGKPIPEDFYFSGDDPPADANLAGSVAMLFACYGAGTPALDEFARQAFQERARIAPQAFVAGLPKALLNRPKGGALAVIGHVERAWGYSFQWQGPGGTTTAQTAVFDSTLSALLGGARVGAAMEYFDVRYAEIASDLSVLIEEKDYGGVVDDYQLAAMWTANNDARGYAVLGDPAVRLVTADGAAVREMTPIAVATGAASGGAPRSTVVHEDLPSGVVQEASFGLLDALREPPAAPPPPTLTERVTGALLRALDDASSLEVSTWSTGDLGQARYEGGRMVGAELRAFTRVALDGDTIVCLPEKDGEVDTAVWEIHREMVKQAQETRAALLQVLVSAATGLAGLVK
jgi:hypothetical protein